VLAKIGRRQFAPARFAIEGNRLADALQRTRRGMDVLQHDPAGGGMRMFDQLRQGVDRRARHAGAREGLVPVRDRIPSKCALDAAERLIPMPHPVGIGAEAGVLGHILQSGNRAELPPQVVVRDADHDRPVRGLEGLVGAERLVARPALRRLDAFLPEGLEVVAEQAHRRVEERNVHGSAPSGLLALDH
jgi:hypothetical protein